MYALFLVSIDDNRLGRLDPTVLPIQAQMEMLVEGFVEKSPFQDAHGNYTEYDTWEFVTVKDGEVDEIAFIGEFNPRYEDLSGGPLHIRLLPWHVRLATVCNYGMHGTFDAKDLPAKIESIDFSYNDLEGSIRTAELPSLLTSVKLDRNKVSGSLDMTKLPQGMKTFLVKKNALSGSLDLTALPVAMKTLNLSVNSFSGEVDLSRLPDHLNKIDLKRNSLSGTINAELLPPNLEGLKASRAPEQKSYGT